ncbi:probable E3 ubiquitin-protein ligase ATL44 [Zingiber officinale]|uniref:probable E3 ubiquitin-protein ligase ATL44 n=1 Tax=Zingiber officinale TaxID=94328 RepID=UPI001C4B3A0A|nr:probable E3 ubiquitin-protein ligase ATL44 [Zingiber officinale]
MPPAARLLQTNSGMLPASQPSEPLSVDSDAVVILAALLCALICVVGLALVARCAWLRQGASASPLCKGLTEKALRDLPKISYGAAADARLAECPICLLEFEGGDEIRILPQCGHGFHVGCIDTWLVSRSNCPSCRRVLVVAAAPAAQPSRPCGASSEGSCATTSTASAAEEVAQAREDRDSIDYIFLH